MKILTTASLALLALTAFGQIDLDKTVAIINGDEIKGTEFYHRMEYLPNVGRPLENGGFLRLSPGMLTILQLVNDHLMLQLAKEKGLLPTDQEIDDAIKERVLEDPNFKTNFLNAGGTEEDLRNQERFSLTEFKLATAGITVSDQEVINAYHNNSIPELSVIPRMVSLQCIAVRDQAAEKTVDSNLAAGQKFDDVAKADSQDATSSNGGHYDKIITDRLPKDVVDVIDKTPQGQLTPWVDETAGKGADGQPIIVHVKYLINEKFPERPVEFSDALKEQIRRRMMLDKARASNVNVMKELADERAKAKIVITNPAYRTEYEQLMKGFFDESKSAAPAGGQ